MRLCLLGTGTPTPSLRRMCSGNALEVGNDYLGFDHGLGAHPRRLELGVAAITRAAVQVRWVGISNAYVGYGLTGMRSRNGR
jgi:hypothetical protein